MNTFVKASEIEKVVSELKQVDRRGGWRRVLAIGEIIVQRVYGGDREACRQPKRRALSIRRIAQHPECPFRKSRLAEAIGVYLVHLDLPFVRDFDHVGPSHVAAVLSLSLDQQAGLLLRAEREKWSVRRLRDAVVSRRRHAGERRGRRPLAPSQRGQQHIQVAVEALEHARRELEPGPEQERVEIALTVLSPLLDPPRPRVGANRAGAGAARKSRLH